ncbi:hypothetical protein NEUTE1DRAFT_57888 [Neurospora tetrasperma FGSC 2508]|uniref:Uncharacterized protein n=1 Tax=Neurospora tetrasperma (strain FGSC 2508 / ATCC MYA-4615 / P0657) TaxID=510951 RepID=F8MF85_NEUT8|nr:uncharacterized protein NEUTE1DRAFT_57888 [Neurospora tetrasperma FGSC 2508]EGO60939.1 hypothetical protein NEUTE1DRAFT_57888 [Neurospora tetrasperma FGSC 2508]EGZ75062.1 hypothetical protein NEUTE2DRAFT_82978 [Neurospora tetrasperma FGSC 2509]
MSTDSNQNNPKRAPYVVRETPVPLPSYADNSSTMSSSGRQLRSRRPAPPPPSEPPSKKRKATSSRAAPEPPQETVQPVSPPLPQEDEGQPKATPKQMPILRPPTQTGGTSPPQHPDDIYRMPPLPPYLSVQPRICEPADNYRGWTTPLEFSYKMNVHPLTFYGSFDIWFEQVQKMAEASNCSIELNTRIGKFPDPGTVEAFICQMRFLSCWRILHGTISGAYWAYMRVLGYSRIPVFTGAPDGGSGEQSGACQWQPQPSDCVYFALEVKKRVTVPNSEQQPRYQTMRMVEEVRSAKVTDYPSVQQYKEGMAWLKEVLNGMILKGDRQVCESMYDRKPDWAPEWPEVPAGGEVEPPWALKGSPLRAEDAFSGSNGSAGVVSISKNAGHIGQQHQPQQAQSNFQIDPRLQAGPPDHHHQQQPNNHAIARLAPMSASSSDGGYSYGGDGSVDFANSSNNLIFMDGTTASAVAVAAAEAHGLGVGGPSRTLQQQENHDSNNQQ